MVKRLFDIAVVCVLLPIALPLVLVLGFAVYLQDGRWPLYSPPRIGKNGAVFHMHKLRTMIVGADKSKVDTTALNDTRITPLGHVLRKCKFDELPQLWNILLGEMSFVGPRPQIDREVALYTDAEKQLLSVAPGITDFASIIFSDLAEIVAPYPDANIAYNQLVRPWKSRLGLFYCTHASAGVDMALIVFTALSVVSRASALRATAWLLARLNAPAELIEVAKRQAPLAPTPPPGSEQIVTSRH